MKQENIRIANLSILKKSCPELYGELATLSNRVRTERLRTLAVIGLYALNRQAAPEADSTDASIAMSYTQVETSTQTAPPEPAPLQRNRQSLKNKLFDSI